MKISCSLLLLTFGFAGASFAAGNKPPAAETGELTARVDERWRYIEVTASAPIPKEVDSVTQANALSREAAIGIAQTELLTYILRKKTRSGKPLAVAEVPSLELQGRVRGMIKGARVTSSQWKDGRCTVKLALPKNALKQVLREN